MKSLLGYFVDFLKSLSRETLVIFILIIPVFAILYIKYQVFNSNINQISKTLKSIEVQVKEQNKINSDLKAYIDVSTSNLKKEIITDVGNQLKYQLIYQNSISRKAIIDQLELWVKSYKIKQYENATSYQSAIDTCFNGH